MKHKTNTHHVSEIDDVVSRQRVQKIDHVMWDELSLFRRHLVRADVQAFVHLKSEARVRYTEP